MSFLKSKDSIYNKLFSASLKQVGKRQNNPGTVAEVSREIDLEAYYKILTLFGKGTIIFNLKNTQLLDLELYSRWALDRKLIEIQKKQREAEELGFHVDFSYKGMFKDITKGQKVIEIRGSRSVREELELKKAVGAFAKGLGVPKSWLTGSTSIVSAAKSALDKNFDDPSFGEPPSNLLFLGLDTGSEFLAPGETDEEIRQTKEWRNKENWRSSEWAGNIGFGAFYSRTNHVRSIWLFNGDTVFETFCIDIANNVEVASCSWPTISAMPFRTSKEFISLMSSDDVFRSRMLDLEKADLKNEYCKLFFEFLIEDIKQRTYGRFLPDLYPHKKDPSLEPF